MQLKEISMFVLAFSVAVTIVNSLGFLPVMPGLETGTINEEYIKNTTGVMQITDNTTMSKEDVDSATFGASQMLGLLSSFWAMTKLVFLPYPYLVAWGVPVVVSLGIQTIISAAALWGVIQFVSNRALRGME